MSPIWTLGRQFPHDSHHSIVILIRIMLLESLTQLCFTKSARNDLRVMNIYVILRELHKTEKDRSCLLLDILIK